MSALARRVAAAERRAEARTREPSAPTRRTCAGCGADLGPRPPSLPAYANEITRCEVCDPPHTLGVIIALGEAGAGPADALRELGEQLDLAPHEALEELLANPQRDGPAPSAGSTDMLAVACALGRLGVDPFDRKALEALRDGAERDRAVRVACQ